MPIYEYQCKGCEKIKKEIFKTISEAMKYDEEAKKNPPKCPYCEEGTLERILSPSNFDIKGYSEKNNYSKPSEKRKPTKPKD